MVEMAFKVNPGTTFYKNYFATKEEKAHFIEIAKQFFDKYFPDEKLSYVLNDRLTVDLKPELLAKYESLSDLSSGIFLQNFDYIVYGKRLASKSENTVEFVENTIVSRNKQELEVVASGMEAMGLSVETGYYDPDDESSVDVPKQLVGFHYVVLKEKV